MSPTELFKLCPAVKYLIGGAGKQAGSQGRVDPLDTYGRYIYGVPRAI